MVVSNIFYFHPYLGKISNLTNIFQMDFNHQREKLPAIFQSTNPWIGASTFVVLAGHDCLEASICIGSGCQGAICFCEGEMFVEIS